jgi:hypothetical protein
MVLRRRKPRPTRQFQFVRPPIEVYRASGAFLTDCLVVDRSLLGDLQRRRILSNSMVTEVLSQRNRPNRVKCLIGQLQQLGPKSVTEFIRSLRAVGQSAIADVVEVQRGTVHIVDEIEDIVGDITINIPAADDMSGSSATSLRGGGRF